MACSALWSCSTATKLAPTSVTPQQLLQRVNRVADTPFAPGTYHLRYRTVSSDGDVTLTDIYEATTKRELPDYRAISIQHGIRGERGKMSGLVWLRTANGLVLSDSALPTSFDRVLMAASRKADPRVRILGITTQPPREFVLEIAPNEHIVQRRYFDTNTFLLRENVTTNYDHNITDDRFRGYANVGGRFVLARELHSDDLSKEAFETTLIQHERLPFDAHLLRIPRSRLPFVPQARLPATVNSIFSKSGIFIRVDIGGGPYWLQLDSGAFGVILDRGLARALGLHEFGRYFTSKAGRIENSYAVLPRMDVGPVFAKHLVVGVLPYNYLEDGVRVQGLLGCDFLSSGPLAIDFHRQTVTVMRATPPPTDRGWTSVRTPLHSCRPFISVRLEGQPANLAFDVGAGNTVINEDVFNRFGSKLHQLGTAPFTYLGGEPLLGSRYVVPDASAGNLQFGPLVVTVVLGGRGQDLQNDGLLGRNVLSNYRLILDYAHGRTYFQRY
jgi:hypothetical protein